MRHALLVQVAAAAVAIAVGGCGSTEDSDFSPKRGTETRESRVGPHEWVCGLAFGQPAEDDVTALVTPAYLFLEVRTGGCDGPGTLLGSSSTGRLVLELAPGGYHIQVGNPGDTTTLYSLQVEHLFPGT